jgi:hypothetical protein
MTVLATAQLPVSRTDVEAVGKNVGYSPKRWTSFAGGRSGGLRGVPSGDLHPMG